MSNQRNKMTAMVILMALFGILSAVHPDIGFRSGVLIFLMFIVIELMHLHETIVCKLLTTSLTLYLQRKKGDTEEWEQ